MIRSLVCLSLVFCGLSANADFVSQILDPFAPVTHLGRTSNLSQNDLGAISPSLTSFAITYDDFTFATTGAVETISWVGIYEVSNSGFNPTFNVSFYQDTASAPGALLAQYTVGTANETALTGAGTNYFSYSTTAANFAVTAGQKYWVSVTANLNYGTDGWAMAYSDTGGNGASVQDFGDTSLTRFNDTFDYAMALNVVVVPEPTSVLAIGAIAGVGLLRRRSRQMGLAFLRRCGTIR